MRIATPNTRKKRDKDSNEEAGDDNQDAEDNHAEDYDVSEDQDPPATDMASIQKQLAKLQKQFEREQLRQSTKPSASNDRAAAGPASTTSSSTEDVPFYNDENLKLGCNIRRLLRSPRKSRSASERPGTCNMRAWVPFKVFRLRPPSSRDS